MSQEPLFLTKDEIKEFTGVAHRKLICEFLSERGIRYEVNRNLDVIVLRDVVKNYLTDGNGPGSGGRGKKASKEKKLNFDK